MFSQNNKISIRQLQALLILDIFGVGVITLPRRVAEMAGQDGWLLVIAGTIFAMLYLWFIGKVGNKFENNSFLEYNSKLLGKILAYILTIGFIIKIILGLGMELRVFGEIIKSVMLKDTPMSVILIAMLLIGSYGAYRGYEIRGRLGEILIPVVILPVIFLMCIATIDADFSNLKPVLLTNGSGIIKGGFITSLGFYGAEYVLLSYPYIRDINKVRKGAITAVAVLGVIILAMTVVTIARFGVTGVKNQLWPVLGIMDTMDLPGSFIERQEALVMSIWIISMFFIVNAGIFFASILCKDIVKKGKHNYYIWAVVPLIFIAAVYPKSLAETYSYLNNINIYLDTVYLVILPIVLFILSMIRRSENEKA